MLEVQIHHRFCGPKTSGNGGYAAGLFAQAIDGPAKITLQQPPPLDTPIALSENHDGGFVATVGDRVIADIRPSTVTIDLPLLPDDGGVITAHENFLSDANNEHLLPYCFVCGDKREDGDGLRLFTGPAPNSPVNADFWTPATDFADENGLVKPEFLWAALDCPSAFALRLWPRLTLLGRLAVEIHRRPVAGERLMVAAWPEQSEGRKHFASSALLDKDRTIIAAANALWIEINDPAFLQKLKQENVA